MRDFFSLDGPFNKYGGMLADMVLVSFMWVLFCLPVVTAGASTTALFYVTTRRIANREGYITSDFWRAFKSNFKRATIIWMFILIVGFILIFNIGLLIDAETVTGRFDRFMMPAQFIMLLLLALFNVYLYALIARFDMSIKEVAKSAFFLTFRHLLTTLGCVALFVAGIVVFIMFPPALIIVPGAYAWLSSILIMKVFKRYRPDMDRDPAQEIAEIEAQKAEERWRRDAGLQEEESESSDETRNI